MDLAMHGLAGLAARTRTMFADDCSFSRRSNPAAWSTVACRRRGPGTRARALNAATSGQPRRRGLADTLGAGPNVCGYMACLFCGSTQKMSREHLWPQWARRTFDSAAAKQQVSHSLHDGSGPAYKAWDAEVFSATIKRVCAACNNGWMSDLEARAQPHAEPLLLGETRTLDSDAQRAISLWAYLKCLLFVAAGGDVMAEALAPAYPTFLDLQAEGLLPLHTSMFTARHIGPRQGQYQHRLLGDGSDLPSLFIQTFTIRQLTVQVVKNYRVRAPIELERDPAVGEADHRIWPVGPSFVWPPGPGLDDSGLTVYTGPQPRSRRWRGNRAARGERGRARFRRS